ncbi:uncharacterized protein [Miscanthus floridulus]|uniref:uncharacterized protein n=1 Tax=Miscanthus floridulus TaxID=154761 RepID=UPI0034578E49
MGVRESLARGASWPSDLRALGAPYGGGRRCRGKGAARVEEEDAGVGKEPLGWGRRTPGLGKEPPVWGEEDAVVGDKDAGLGEEDAAAGGQGVNGGVERTDGRRGGAWSPARGAAERSRGRGAAGFMGGGEQDAMAVATVISSKNGDIGCD